MKKNKLTLVFFISILVCSCHGQKKSDANSSLKSPDSLFVIKEIPHYKNGKPNVFYSFVSDMRKRLQLDSLEKGFDSIEIRLWYYYSFKKDGQLIIFTNSNSKWMAKLFTLGYHYGDSADSLLSVSKEIIEKEPKSGWTGFSNRLFNLKILLLPNCTDIPEYTPGTDGDYIIVETATRTKYRFYYYAQPAHFQNEIWQAKNMEQIMELIEDDFDFKPLRVF